MPLCVDADGLALHKTPDLAASGLLFDVVGHFVVTYVYVSIIETVSLFGLSIVTIALVCALRCEM